MSVNYRATLFKGYRLSSEDVHSCLDKDSIAELIEEGVLHLLNQCSQNQYYIFGYPTGDYAIEGYAVPLTDPCPNPCRDNKENHDLMIRAMKLFPSKLSHNYPKYYMALVIY